MFEVFRDRKLEQEQAAQDIVGVQAPAKGGDVQRKTPRLKPETAGSSPSSPQAVLQTSQEKLRELMETQKTSGTSAGPQAEKIATASEDQRLVVGPRIRLQGDVTNCDTLIIEGHFEGSAKTRMIQVARGGTVSGEAEVETAEIVGEFEVCLSVPGFNATVARPMRAVVKGLARDGHEQVLEGTGLLARCLQHEIDHLDGTLFVDRLRGLQKTLIVRKIKKLSRSGKW